MTTHSLGRKHSGIPMQEDTTGGSFADIATCPVFRPTSVTTSLPSFSRGQKNGIRSRIRACLLKSVPLLGAGGAGSLVNVNLYLPFRLHCCGCGRAKLQPVSPHFLPRCHCCSIVKVLISSRRQIVTAVRSTED